MSVLKTGVVVFVLATIVAIAAFLFHRRSALPPHLKPYLENWAEVDASVNSHKEAMAKRRKELTEPTSAAEASEYLMLNDFQVLNPTYEQALRMVESSLKDDPFEYGLQLGEIYAFSKVYKDYEKAYYFYYIGYSQDGCSVEFKDQNHDPPYYCGPVGDFRNESVVSMLVVELGFDKVKQIDQEASEWLESNNFDVALDEADFLEEPDSRTYYDLESGKCRKKGDSEK